MQVRDLVTFLFSPSGKIRRLQFFLGYFGIIFVAAILMEFIRIDSRSLLENALISSAVQNSPTQFNLNTSLSGIVAPLSLFVIFLLTGWAQICLMIKRLRDLKLTPWLVIFPYAAYLSTLSLYAIKYSSQGINQPIDISKFVCLLLILGFYLLLLFCPTRSVANQT
jgi:uncharacterized membrane protein YhaH (DUF805 family)